MTASSPAGASDDDLAALAALAGRGAPPVPTRVVELQDVLGADIAEGLLARLAASEADFVRTDLPGRAARVLRPPPAWCAPFAECVTTNATALLAPFGLTVDDVVVPAIGDVVVGHFGHADFFAPHRDNSAGGVELPASLTARRITIAYHLARTPLAFAGGELHFLDPTIVGTDDHEIVDSLTVPCRSDGIVAFESSARHEVRTVTLPHGAFADGRFSLVTHFLARPT